MAIFTLNIIVVIFSFTLYILPAIPLTRLAFPGYRPSPLQRP